MLGRVPAAGQRERDREARSGKAQDYSERKGAGEAVYADIPCEEQTSDHDQLVDGPRQLGTEAVAEQAVDDAKHRSSERRSRDHQPFFRRVEPEVLGDQRRERTQDHPDHEREVEIQKRGNQRRRVAGLEE